MTTHYPLMTHKTFNNLDKIEITAPFDGTTIATADLADAKAVESALSVAHALFQDKSAWLPKSQRIDILNTAADIMQQQTEELTLQAAHEGGKPYLDSKVEVIRAIDSIRTCADCLRNTAGKEIPMGINAASEKHLAFTTHEPIGVVVAVSAFNHPLNLIAHQAGPAIAAGCPVIIKPTQDTPISCFKLVDILRQAGLPDAWCQVLLINDRTLATNLVSDPRVAFFSFIGSAKVGWMLRSKLAEGTRCALEHGGVAPVIIEADADIETTLPAVAKGGFYHAGQVCVSVQRLYCQQAISSSVVDGLKTIAQQLKVGDPTDKNTDVGPLIRPREVERIHRWVQEAIDEGAKLVCGGSKLSDSCYAPTILLNPSQTSKVSQQEIFGPVICIYEYEYIDEAIQQANDIPFSFQASVFTSTIDTAMYAFKQLNGSAIMVNEHTAFRVDWMPFSGLKRSGLGVGGIQYSFHDMQIEKMLVMKSSAL
ncbi:MAG TPA: aldehyde dehydrogenase family protein [Gammaproteobacteria bacterium]|nr:aldehyde dehydrogenase family protein [Gammaproteobacteria bacterium]